MSECVEHGKWMKKEPNLSKLVAQLIAPFCIALYHAWTKLQSLQQNWIKQLWQKLVRPKCDFCVHTKDMKNV